MRTLILILSVVVLAGCAPQLTGSGGSSASAFIIFFDNRSATLSPEAAETVKSAAAVVKRTRPATVLVAGEPTTTISGTDISNLGNARYGAVQQALVAAGVDPKLVARAALTDTEAKVAPLDKFRVEIRLFNKG